MDPITVTKSKFPIGKIVMTANAARRIPMRAIKDSLRRHEFGDWGDLPPEDARSNEDALKQGDRLLSAYGQDQQRFWIITECDRSVTTILLPEDY